MVNDKSNLDQLRELSKRLEETEYELQEAHARYQSFIRNSTEGIWRTELRRPVPIDLPVDHQIKMIFTDRSAYLAEANEKMAEMYKMSVAELLEAGDDIGNLLPIEDNYNYIRTFIENGYKTSEALSIEKDAEGEIHYFMNSMVGEIEDGYLVRAWGVQRDVTNEYLTQQELKRQREIYELIVNNIGDLLALISLDGIVQFASPSYKTVLGYTGEELVGMNVFDMIHKDDLERARAAFDEAISSKHSVAVEVRVRKKNRRFILLRSTGVAVRDEKGQPEVVLNIGREKKKRTN